MSPVNLPVAPAAARGRRTWTHGGGPGSGGPPSAAGTTGDLGGVGRAGEERA